MLCAYWLKTDEYFLKKIQNWNKTPKLPIYGINTLRTQLYSQTSVDAEPVTKNEQMGMSTYSANFETSAQPTNRFSVEMKI